MAINVGLCPSKLATVLMLLLPKSSGGWRTIGIFTSVVRLYMRWTRRHITDLWERTFVRPYWFGQRGSTCQQCTWRLSMVGEYARATGQAAASSLVDLAKAYEYIDHPYVWQMGQKHGFNMRILRFLLGLYCGPRILMVNGVATARVHALLATVIAGCAHATALMKLSLVDSLDYALGRWPSVQAAVVVDDTQFQVIGTPALVKRAIAGVTKDFRSHIEDVARMLVSVPKLEVLTNCDVVAQGLRRDQMFKGCLNRSTRNLGADYACGRRIGRQVGKNRIKQGKVRKPFLKRLRQAGANVARLVQSGIVPAIVYGSNVTGMRPPELRTARGVVHAVLYEHAFGRSVDIDLSLEALGVDPAYRGTVDCILMWKAALMDQWLPRSWMFRTMVTAIKDGKQAKQPFDAVFGPTSAVVATCSRFGWQFTSAAIVHTHRGDIDIDAITMGELKVLCDEGFELWRWANVQRSNRHSIGPDAPPPLIEPVKAALRKVGCPLARCAIKLIFANNVWTQARKYDERYAVTDICQLCGQGRGTLLHRCYQCIAFDRFRYFEPHCLNVPIQRWAATLPEAQLWTRLLLADPTWDAPPACADEHIVWMTSPVCGYFDEIGLGDGSLWYGRTPRLARGGWGLVVLDKELNERARLHGPLPGLHQDILLAECVAFWQYLRHLGPLGGHYYTDSKSLVTMWLSGPASCCDAFSVYSGIWRLIWAKVDEIGCTLVEVTWIKGHASKTHVAKGLLEGWQREGNIMADAEAKAGSGMHTPPTTQLRLLETRAKSLEWVAIYLGLLHAWMWKAEMKDTTLWEKHSCLASGTLIVTRRKLVKSKIRKAAESHLVATSGQFQFCIKCGCYSEVRWQGLTQLCRGHLLPHSAHTRQRLLNGRHPRLDRSLGDVILLIGPTSYRYARKDEQLARRAASCGPSTDAPAGDSFSDEAGDDILFAMLADSLPSELCLNDDLGDDLPVVYPRAGAAPQDFRDVDAVVALEDDGDRAPRYGRRRLRFKQRASWGHVARRRIHTKSPASMLFR